MNSILRLRKKCGLSQQAVADYIGVSRSLVNLAEKGLRELPKAALIKLGELEKIAGAAEFDKQSATEHLDKKLSKELKDYHKFKIEEYLYRAEGLKRQVVALSNSHKKTGAKLKLVNGLAKSNSKTGKNKAEHIWTKYHEQQSSGKLSKYNATMDMLIQDTEVLLGYAAVHEKMLKKFF